MKRTAQAGLGLIAGVMAFAALGPLAGFVVIWFLLSPDGVAQTARAGGVGALAAGASAGGKSLAEQWRKDGPARKRRRSERRDRWWAAGEPGPDGRPPSRLGRAKRRLLQGEHAAIVFARFAPTSVIAGIAAWKAAREAFAEKKAEVRARRNPDAVTPRTERDSDSDSAFAYDRGPVVHTDDMSLVTKAYGATCPRCGTPWQPHTTTFGDGSQGTRMRCPNCGAHRSLNAHSEEHLKRTHPTDSGRQQAAGDTPPATATGENMPDEQNSTGAELQTTADLRAETAAIAAHLEQMEILGGILRDYQAALPDAYTAGAAAGGPQTGLLAESIAALSESADDPTAYTEALNAIRLACDQADSLGEMADAMGANSGHGPVNHTAAYVNN